MDRRCSVLTVTSALVLFVAITAHLPAGVRSSAIRPASGTSSVVRHRRDVLTDSTDVIHVDGDAVPDSVVREKRTLLKLKPLVVLPAKIALGAGAKLVHGAKLGVKAVGLGAKALGVGSVGLKTAKKVAKVTVKAATALGIKAVLLNFLFQVKFPKKYFHHIIIQIENGFLYIKKKIKGKKRIFKYNISNFEMTPKNNNQGLNSSLLAP